jgi:hypothetical protein
MVLVHVTGVLLHNCTAQILTMSLRRVSKRCDYDTSWRILRVLEYDSSIHAQCCMIHDTNCNVVCTAAGPSRSTTPCSIKGVNWFWGFVCMFVWQKRADNPVHILIQIMRQNCRRHSNRHRESAAKRACEACGCGWFLRPILRRLERA